MQAAPTIPAPHVAIAEDALAVTLKPPADGVNGPTPDELLAYLDGIGIRGIDPAEVYALATPGGRIHIKNDVVLLRGRRPIPERPGRVELLVDPEAPTAAAVASHYDRATHLVAKHAGQIIARLIPPTSGQDGIDVFGNAIPHARASISVELGRNVELDRDGATVRATAPGRIIHRRGILCVETAVEVAGDVDFSCGNIDVAGDVTIGGSVLDLFRVRGANVRVGGAVEAADVNAAFDLVVAGGILGKDKGRCAAGGNVSFKYATNASIAAGGDVYARGEITHTRIVCRGRLTVEGAPLTSGHVTANGGVVCGSLGSAHESKLVVEVGIDDFLRQPSGPGKLAEITARRARANQLSSTAAQFLRFQKNLTPKQKEQATELLYEAAEAEAAAAEILRPLRDALAVSRQRCSAEVVVENTLHAGVTIRFPLAETIIPNDFAGPLRVRLSTAHDEPQVLLIDTAHNSCHTLPCKRWHDPVYESFVRAIES